MIFLVALYMYLKQKKSQAQRRVRKKLQGVKFGVLKSLYKRKTRKNPKYKYLKDT